MPQIINHKNMSNSLLRTLPSIALTLVFSVLTMSPACVNAAITHGFAYPDHPNGILVSLDVMDWTSTPDVLGSDSILPGGETVQWASASTAGIEEGAFWGSGGSYDSTRIALMEKTAFFAMISQTTEPLADNADCGCTWTYYDPPLVVITDGAEFEIHAGYVCDPNQNIPEPSSFILISLAAGTGIHRRKRRKRQIG